MAVRIVFQTFERTDTGDWALVLEHRFYGKTVEEAEGYVASHLKADAFFRSCSTEGSFMGQHGEVVCVNRSWAENVPDSALRG